MTINLKAPELRELKPRIMVCGIGGAGGNAVNNMIVSGLIGVDFIVANTDAQALTSSKAERIIQMGLQVTEGLGAGSHPEIGRAAAEEAIEEIRDHLAGAHMVFVTAGMGGGTGTGAAPVVAQAARDMGILTVGVVTKPFQFEGSRRMRIADQGIEDLQKAVDTLIVIPNQNLFRIATEKTTFADAFAMADQVLYSGVACITDLMVKEGLINLDFADVRAIMRQMGKAMMGTGEASGDKRAILAAEAAIANPLLDEVSMKGARGLLISITGGNDLTLYEVDEAASRIRQEVDEDANIILGATFDSNLDGIVRVSVVATGIDQPAAQRDMNTSESRIAEVASRLRAQAAPPRAIEPPAPRYMPPVREPEPVAQHEDHYEQAPVDTMPAPVPMMHAAAMHHDVQVQPVAPRVVQYHQPEPRPVEPQIETGPYIPPAAEQPMRPVRMPPVEEFPIPAQNQIRAAAQRGVQRPPAAFDAQSAENKRRTLLERLASFGMSRQDEAQAAPMQPRVSAPQAPAAQMAPAHPAPVARLPMPNAVHAEYSKRPSMPMAPQPRTVQQGYHLDAHGRAPVARQEDDQLEIPAFLRRQTS